MTAVNRGAEYRGFIVLILYIVVQCTVAISLELYNETKLIEGKKKDG